MAQRRTTRRAGARRRSAADEAQEDDGRRRGGRNQSPNMAPVVGIVAAVAVIGVCFAIYANQNKQPGPAGEDGARTAPAVDPFAGVPDESGPRGQSPGGRRSGTVDRSPADLLDDPLWRAAAARANEGYALDAEAQAAFKAKDNDAYLAQASAAKDLFNKLLEDTAEWETQVSEDYGDNDRRVKQVKAERDKWFRISGKYKGLHR